MRISGKHSVLCERALYAKKRCQQEREGGRKHVKNDSILTALRGKLIVSCQALESEPMYCDTMSLMGHFAKAAAQGGAAGIRANTVRDIEQIRRFVDLPILGIIKRVYGHSEVFITPTMREVDALVGIGCEIIAMDATCRERPGAQPLETLFAHCHREYPDQLFMADCSTYEEGMRAAELGFDVVSTTLAGYTTYTKELCLPDLECVRRLKENSGAYVIAEGGIWTPEQLRMAFEAGADAAVVGTAITRPMEITRRFVRAIE